jgi:hypothetical protein
LHLQIAEYTFERNHSLSYDVGSGSEAGESGVYPMTEKYIILDKKITMSRRQFAKAAAAGTIVILSEGFPGVYAVERADGAARGQRMGRSEKETADNH